MGRNLDRDRGVPQAPSYNAFASAQSSRRTPELATRWRQSEPLPSRLSQHGGIKVSNSSQHASDQKISGLNGISASTDKGGSLSNSSPSAQPEISAEINNLRDEKGLPLHITKCTSLQPSKLVRYTKHSREHEPTRVSQPKPRNTTMSRNPLNNTSVYKQRRHSDETGTSRQARDRESEEIQSRPALARDSKTSSPSSYSKEAIEAQYTGPKFANQTPNNEATSSRPLTPWQRAAASRASFKPSTPGQRGRRNNPQGPALNEERQRDETLEILQDIERDVGVPYRANRPLDHPSTNGSASTYRSEEQRDRNDQEQAQEWRHLRSAASRAENPEVNRIKNLASDLRAQRSSEQNYQSADRRFVSFDNPREVDSSHTRSEKNRQPTQEFKRPSVRSGDIDEDQARDHKFSGKQRRDRRRVEAYRPQREDEEEGMDEDDGLSRIERRQQRKREKMLKKAKNSTIPILLPEYISIGSLARALRIRVEDFADKLMDLGFQDLGNDHIIDAETAGLIAGEFNFDPILPKATISEDIVALPPPDDTSRLLARPPVITIMGHVDHGKTTLLDWLRKSSVAASEHGGITQHIGAFTVSMPSGRIITFLDTPGHAAFLDMRARGANVTDIVILVVAADDSVKPQTIEAIKHAKAAKVPIMVAINKVDKEGANPERVKQDLARHGIEVEDFGGETQTVSVSGKTGQGMEELEDAVIALADVLDVRADATGQVEGWVLEATKKKSGKVATVLVRRGTLTPGTILVAGQTWTRVRSLRNEAGVVVASAGPGTPIEVDGWREQPDAGAEALQAPDEQRARRVVEFRKEDVESRRMAEDVASLNEARQSEELRRERELSGKADADASKAETSTPGLTEVPFVLRADVSGSVEALEAAVLSLGNSEVRARVLRSAVGPLSPSDVDHAAAVKGHLISFNTPIDGNIIQQAEKAGVKVLDESVIYKLVDEVKSVLEEKLPPSVSSKVTGEAEVAQVFEISVKGGKLPVAGVRVRNGVMKKGEKVRISRKGEVVYDGEYLFGFLSACHWSRVSSFYFFHVL